MSGTKIEWEDINVGDLIEFRCGPTDKITIVVADDLGEDIAYSGDGQIRVRRSSTSLTAIYRLHLALPKEPGTMIYNIQFVDTSAPPRKWSVLLEGGVWIAENGRYLSPEEVSSFSLTPTEE